MPDCADQNGIALCQHAETFCSAFEAFGVAAAQVSLDGKWVLVNQRFCDLVGFSRTEVMSTLFHEFFTDGRSEDAELQQIVSGSVSSHTGERTAVLKNGRIIRLRTVFSLFRDQATNLPKCLLVLFEDVTTRKADEASLDVAEQRFRRMTDAVPTLIWISDANKTHSYFNRSWLDFTNRTLGEELGEGWTEDLHPDDLRIFLDAYGEAFKAREPFTLEYRLRRADGQYRWISDTAIPRALPDGSFGGYIGCCLDVSDRRESEQARRQLSDRLIESQEAERTRIARELHDDIGQSLAILCVQMQRAGKPVSGADGKRHPGLPQLTDAVNKIAKKVSQISHQLHSSELEYLGLKVALQSACREFADRLHIKVDLLCERVPPKIDGVVGLCFLRVVQEALHNIDKHSGAHNVEIRLTGSDAGLSLEIADDGRGFDLEEAHLAAGLGLISMRERVHLIGGQFEIISQIGKGTRIGVYSPVSPAKNATAQTPS